MPAQQYRGRAGEAYFAWQRESARLSARLDPPVFQPFVGPADTVLDFGCGTGALLAELRAGPKLGVEANPAAREAAAQNGIKVFSETEEVRSESVDVVISNHTLEHVLQPLAELRLLHAVLKPGGRIVLRLPLDDWRVQRDQVDDGNHHLYAWTPRLIANLVREAGFRIERSDVVTYAWPPRAGELVDRVPALVFDLLARATAVALRRRQLLVVARRP